jgi:hypothetical protein
MADLLFRNRLRISVVVHSGGGRSSLGQSLFAFETSGGSPAARGDPSQVVGAALCGLGSHKHLVQICSDASAQIIHLDQMREQAARTKDPLADIEAPINGYEGAVCADGIPVVLGRLEMLNHTVTDKPRPSARGVMSLDPWNSEDVCPPGTEGAGDFREHRGRSKDVFHDVLRDVPHARAIVQRLYARSTGRVMPHMPVRMVTVTASSPTPTMRTNEGG